MKKNFLFIIILAIVACINAQAQESIRSQMVNNRVSGVKYAPSSFAKQATPNKGFNGSSLAHELKGGTAKGLRFAGGGSTVEPKTKSASAATQQPELSSSKPLVKEEAAQAKTVAPALPAQGEVTQEQADAFSKKQTSIVLKTPATPTQEEKPKETKVQ